MDVGLLHVRSARTLRGAGTAHLLPVKHPMTAEELLKLCHAYLRGVEIHLPDGRHPVDKDLLARAIAEFLNKHN